MPDFICSVDPGNGGTNAVLAKSNGGYKNIYFPSVRAAATGDSLGLGTDMELQYDYADWYGHRYIVGDDVIRVTRRNLERHMGVNRYGNELYQFLVAIALAKLGISKGTVDLTVFAPPGMYNEAKEIMLERLSENGKKVEIKFRGDKKPRVWKYETITVWPEGLGAAACFILDDVGNMTQSGVLAGDTIILDIGAYTFDALKMVDGNFNPEALEHATWENGGLNAHLREPVLRAVKQLGEDFGNLSIDDIDLVIRRGLAGEGYKLKVAGHEVELQPLIEKYSLRHAEWIANNICDGVFDSLRGIKSAIVVGGGATLTEEHLRKWYGDKILDRKKYSTTANIHPVDFNAVGGLRLARMRLKQAG
jgi:hypothetical protein